MQVLILEDEPAFQAQLAQAMMAKGFNVLCVETVQAAEAFLRLDMADVLILGERIGGRLSHPVALLAEYRNPLLAAVLLTDRTGPDVDELFDLLPALVSILGRRVAPAVVTQVVMAAVAGSAHDSVRSRLAARWASADALQQEDAPLDVPANRLHQVTVAEMATEAEASQKGEVTATATDRAPSAVASTCDVGEPVSIKSRTSLPSDEASVISAHQSGNTATGATLPKAEPLTAGSDMVCKSLSVGAPASLGRDSPLPMVATLAVVGPATPLMVQVAASTGATQSSGSGDGERSAVVLPQILRPSRPLPDSALARVLAGGQRAVAVSGGVDSTRIAADVTRVDIISAGASRLCARLEQPRAEPARVKQGVVPLAASQRPVAGLPVDRRLHLA